MIEPTKHTCPTCGTTLDEREITLYSGMIHALKRVFEWCEKRGIYEFTRKDIKHFLTSDNEIARFGDLVLFGGLVYRPKGKKKGNYGINVQRTRDFFAGKYEIPTSIWKNPITKTLSKEKYCFIDDIPSLYEFLDKNQEFIARYRTPIQPIQRGLL